MHDKIMTRGINRKEQLVPTSLFQFSVNKILLFYNLFQFFSLGGWVELYGKIRQVHLAKILLILLNIIILINYNIL